MKKFSFFYLLLALPLLFSVSSCHDDDSPGVNPVFVNPPSAFDFKNIRQDALDHLTQNFTATVDGTGEIVFTSAKGVEVRISEWCLNLNGQPVSGEVEVEFVELYERGNLLSTNIATMGRHANGDLEMLVTGGAFYLNVYQNGVALDPWACFNLRVPTDNTGGVDHDMVLWYGNFDANDNLVWDEIGDVEQGVGLEMSNDLYYAYFGQFGWCNVDRFYNDPRPQTSLKVAVPQGYTDMNSSVYLSYDGEANGLARLDTFDQPNGLFSEHYGRIPIGLACHLIFVSEYQGAWVYAIKPISIVENEIISFNMNELNVATEAQLTQLINNLP